MNHSARRLGEVSHPALPQFIARIEAEGPALQDVLDRLYECRRRVARLHRINGTQPGFLTSLKG